MAWNAPRSWAVNEVLTASNMNTYLSGDLEWLGTSRPHARVKDASFSHGSSGAWLSPSWDTLSTNVGSMAAAGNGYLTMSTGGFYLIGGGATFASNATGARALMLSSGSAGTGTVYAQCFFPSQSVAIGGTVVTMLQCSSSQPVYLSAFQGSGAALTLTDVHMWALWVTT